MKGKLNVNRTWANLLSVWLPSKAWQKYQCIRMAQQFSS